MQSITFRQFDTNPAIQQAGYMKATFQIPDELYREVKAETAREGRSSRGGYQSFRAMAAAEKAAIPFRYAS